MKYKISDCKSVCEECIQYMKLECNYWKKYNKHMYEVKDGN